MKAVFIHLLSGLLFVYCTYQRQMSGLGETFWMELEEGN